MTAARERLATAGTADKIPAYPQRLAARLMPSGIQRRLGRPAPAMRLGAESPLLDLHFSTKT
jgi:hypothetical protein